MCSVLVDGAAGSDGSSSRAGDQCIFALPGIANRAFVGGLDAAFRKRELWLPASARGAGQQLLCGQTKMDKFGATGMTKP
jgi:hypothetical protein